MRPKTWDNDFSRENLDQSCYWVDKALKNLISFSFCLQDQVLFMFEFI